VLPDTLPPQFVPIVRQCLNRDPANRPTVAELAAQIDPAPQAATVPVSYPVLLPPRFPVLLPPEPLESAAAHLASEEQQPESAIPAQRSPQRRSFVPAGTAILVVLIVAWIGPRLFGSQAYSTPTAWLAVASRSPAAELPAATMQRPAADMSASSARSTAAPNAGSVDATAAVAPPSVLHEEAPDVPPGALQTIQGHIKFAVRVTVDRSGTVVHATLAGHSPSRYFTRVAIETARKWKFFAADTQDSRQWLLRFEFTRGGATAQASATRMRRVTLG
jgi:TonB family protein